MKVSLVTTSWDDGHKYDIRLARVLKEYGLSGTFYISPHNREIAKDSLLNPQEISDIGNDFEIGAHTMTHPRLPTLSESQAEAEISESKLTLEVITGKVLSSFCYPAGAYDDIHVQLVRDAGFTYARTIKRHKFAVGNPYEAATTLHTYNHWTDIGRIAKFAGFRPVRCLQYRAWDAMARDMFDYVKREGGMFHLWGHSWEIDRFQEWERLEDVCRYISGHSDVSYVTNSELV